MGRQPLGATAEVDGVDEDVVVEGLEALLEVLGDNKQLVNLRLHVGRQTAEGSDVLVLLVVVDDGDHLNRWR